jgi:fido (protein-threonine AMPylation protein)
MPDGEEFLDPYLDPETGILRSLAGARTKAALDDAEASLSFARLVQLMDRPPKPTGDLTELRATTTGPGRSAPSTSRTSRALGSSCRQA